MAIRFARRLRYNLYITFRKIDKFIKKFHHNTHLAIKGIFQSRENQKKFKEIGTYLFNLLFTGVVIHYALTHFNPLSLGIISALFMYYFSWIVKTIRGQQK